MKRLLLIVSLTLLIVGGLVVGCTSERGKIYIDFKETINTGVDDEFAIALDANLTSISAGYTWQVDYDDTILNLDYEDYSTERCPGLLGSGGTQYFGFTALKKGETEITLEYMRSFEEGSIETRVFTVNVR